MQNYGVCQNYPYYQFVTLRFIKHSVISWFLKKQKAGAFKKVRL
ncbi:MAG: hypothetical protein V4642_13590 [Bacteroidota bacterium]